MRFTFDLETNGLYQTVNRLHCMTIRVGADIHQFRPSEVLIGVRMLQQALNDGHEIAGHNIIGYDIPVLEKLYPQDFKVQRHQRPQVVDTLVLSRLLYPTLKDWDFTMFKKGLFPGKLIGSHSLKAWGYRIGELKGELKFEEGEAWAIFTEEMLAYNVQDTIISDMLMDKFAAKSYPEKAITLEHEIQWLMAHQERNGFPFDVQKAEALEVTLRSEMANVSFELQRTVPEVPDKVFTPKVNNKAKGYTAGVPIQRYKDFNPNSRQQIEWLMRVHYDYIPNNEDLFDEGRLKIDDETFTFVKSDPEAPTELRTVAVSLEKYLMLSKRLGQLIDGKQGWLKAVQDDGRIHGSVNPNGAVTGRATHASPNVAQVPAGHSPYGKECRELFNAGGWFQVGVDAKGLELRCLAHFMHPYDLGVYAAVVTEGDVHTMNQIAAGLPTRDDAKTFIYAFLYGAGDAKIGRIVKGTAADGKRLKKSFLTQTPAIRSLKAAIESVLIDEEYRGKVVKWKRHYLLGLDGRTLNVRSIHSALNLLLQSAGALICKKWCCLLDDKLSAEYKHGWDGDYAFLAWVHDEVQVAARTKEIADRVAVLAEEAMIETKEFFGFKVTLGTDAKIGMNWSECH
jgi:DNA polymerase I